MSAGARFMRLTSSLALFTILLLVLSPLRAADFGTRIVMKEKAAATYYVPTRIEGAGEAELMVDTGSGYVTISSASPAPSIRVGT